MARHLRSRAGARARIPRGSWNRTNKCGDRRNSIRVREDEDESDWIAAKHVLHLLQTPCQSLHTVAVMANDKGFAPCGNSSLFIQIGIVTDMQNFAGLYSESPRGFKKDPGSRFGCANLTGDNHILERLKYVQILQNNVEPPIEIRNHTKPDP